MRKLLYTSVVLVAVGSVAWAQSVGWPPPAGMMAALGVYNSTPPTLTNGQVSSLQITSAGKLMVDATLTPSGIQAVSIADGADVTQGALADAACATDNGTCTVNAILKRIAQRSTSLITALGTPFQAGASIGNTSFIQTPTASALTTTSITVTNSSATFLAASTATKFLLCKNESATATIALNFANGTAVLNTAGNITLTPGASISFDGTQVPIGAITGISSVASSPATCVSS